MMLGFGLFAMLLVIGVPVALIVVLIWTLTRRGNSSAPQPIPVQAKTTAAHACPHCGAALQTDWSHCPQCGASA